MGCCISLTLGRFLLPFCDTKFSHTVYSTSLQIVQYKILLAGAFIGGYNC